MRQVLSLVALLLCASCATTERAAYIGIGTTTTAVEIARQAYVNHENTCACVTQSEHDKVMGYYVKYQAAFKVAQEAITAYKTATVPNESGLRLALDVVNTCSTDLIALIESLIPASDAVKLQAKIVKGTK